MAGAGAVEGTVAGLARPLGRLAVAPGGRAGAGALVGTTGGLAGTRAGAWRSTGAARWLGEHWGRTAVLPRVSWRRPAVAGATEMREGAGEVGRGGPGVLPTVVSTPGGRGGAGRWNEAGAETGLLTLVGCVVEVAGGGWVEQLLGTSGQKNNGNDNFAGGVQYRYF